MGKFSSHNGDGIHAEWWKKLIIYCNGRYKYTDKQTTVGRTDMVTVKGDWTLKGKSLVFTPRTVTVRAVNGIVDEDRKKSLKSKKSKYTQAETLEYKNNVLRGGRIYGGLKKK